MFIINILENNGLINNITVALFSARPPDVIIEINYVMELPFFEETTVDFP